MRKLLLLLLILSVWSCKNNDTKTDKTEQVIQKVVSPQEEKAKPLSYPSIPKEIIVNLYENSEYMDYIFHDLNFSISQDSRSSIRSSLAFISKETPKEIGAGCKSLGRKFFHVNGEIVLEAEVYFTNTCAFYIFFVDGKPTYANKMTQEGLNFYANIIKAGQKQEQKIIKERSK